MVETFRPQKLNKDYIINYNKNLNAAKHRILIGGMRGKSGLVLTLYRLLSRRGIKVLGKVTGLRPLIFYNGRVIKIDRGSNGKFFIDQENVGIFAKFPAEVYIVENQAISRPAIRHMSRIIKPDIVVLTNIRLEHMEGLGERLEDIAEAFALGFKGAKYVIYAKSPTREDGEIIRVLEKHATKYGSKLKIVDLPKKLRKLPAAERAFLAEEVLKIMGFDLQDQEKEEIIKELESRLKPSSSPLGIDWFDASKVNDPESTELILNHLDKRPLFLLAHFRGDRVDRTLAFIDLFSRLRLDSRIRKVWVTGRYYGPILRVLGEKGRELDLKGLPSVVKEVKASNGILVLVVNGVTDFMDRVRQFLLSGKMTKNENEVFNPPFVGEANFTSSY